MTNTKEVVQEHDVLADFAGFRRHPRLTCRTTACNGATFVVQPYMTQELVDQKEAEFLEAHPCSNIKKDYR